MLFVIHSKGQNFGGIGDVARGMTFSRLLSCKNAADRDKMKNARTAIIWTGEAEIDSVFSFWARRYMKAPVEFFYPGERDQIEGKKYAVISVNTFESRNENHNFLKKQTVFQVESSSDLYFLYFDGLYPVNTGHFIGIDKSPKDIANKLLQFLLAFQHELNAGSRRFMMGQGLLQGAPTGTLKQKTILVPTEYLSNGLTKADFGSKYRIEFLPASEIAAKVRKGENLDGYAQLFVTKVDEEVSQAIVFDLADFGLLGWAQTAFGLLQKNMMPVTPKTMSELMEMLEQKF
jgi:hypothetical protein